MEYLINTEHLYNTVHEITYEQLELLYKDNLREAEESRRITASSYRGENYYTENGNLGAELEKEYLIRDPRTSGMRRQCSSLSIAYEIVFRQILRTYVDLNIQPFS